jgi:hypothetical protein
MKAALSLFAVLGITTVACGFFAGGELPGTFGEERGRAERLAAEQQYLLSRSDYKRATTEALIAGDITFKQALAEFKNLNELGPQCMTGLRIRHPGGTDEEILRQDIIEHIEALLGPDAAAETVARLNEESYE